MSFWTKHQGLFRWGPGVRWKVLDARYGPGKKCSMCKKYWRPLHVISDMHGMNHRDHSPVNSWSLCVTGEPLREAESFSHQSWWSYGSAQSWWRTRVRPEHFEYSDVTHIYRDRPQNCWLILDADIIPHPQLLVKMSKTQCDLKRPTHPIAQAVHDMWNQFLESWSGGCVTRQWPQCDNVDNYCHSVVPRLGSFWNSTKQTKGPFPQFQSLFGRELNLKKCGLFRAQENPVWLGSSSTRKPFRLNWVAKTPKARWGL